MSLLTKNGTKAVVMTLPARLQNMQTSAEIEVNVFLDTCSNVTLLTQNAADRLNLTSSDAKFSLSGIGDTKTSMVSALVDTKVISMDGTFSTVLEKIQVIPVITNDVVALDWSSHLRKFNKQGFQPVGDGKIDLLIGMDYSALILHRDFIEQEGEPLYIQTSLGWSGCGVVSQKEVASMRSYFLEGPVPENPMSHEEDKAPAEVTTQNEDRGDHSGDVELCNYNVSLLSLLSASNKVSKTDIKYLIELVEKSYKYDNFPESGNSVEDEYCLKLLQDTYEIRDGKAYISPLWREGQPSGFVTNYGYVLARLKSILKGMSEKDFDCIDKIVHDY